MKLRILLIVCVFGLSLIFVSGAFAQTVTFDSGSYSFDNCGPSSQTAVAFDIDGFTQNSTADVRIAVYDLSVLSNGRESSFLESPTVGEFDNIQDNSGPFNFNDPISHYRLIGTSFNRNGPFAVSLRPLENAVGSNTPPIPPGTGANRYGGQGISNQAVGVLLIVSQPGTGSDSAAVIVDCADGSTFVSSP